MSVPQAGRGREESGGVGWARGSRGMQGEGSLTHQTPAGFYHQAVFPSYHQRPREAIGCASPETLRGARAKTIRRVGIKAAGVSAVLVAVSCAPFQRQLEIERKSLRLRMKGVIKEYFRTLKSLRKSAIVGN